MTSAKLGAVLFAGALSLTSLPAWASPVTDAFLANVGANAGFLTASSRMVTERSASAAIRKFATNEIAEQAQVAQALIRLGPALAMASPAEPVATGRSVAIDESPASSAESPATTLQAANGRHALGQAELDQLKAVSGKALDDLYWQQQLDALSQLEADYRTYIEHGDDPALVAMAKADLPRVMTRIEALTKI